MLRTIALSLGVGLSACGGGGGEPSWVLNECHSYALALNSRNEVSSEVPLFELELTAEMRLVPVRRNGAQTEFALVLAAPVLRARQSGQPVNAERISSDLAKPFGFTLDRGKLTQTRAAPDLNPLAIGIMRSLSAAFQRQESGRTDGSRRWQASEYDATGRYLAEYERLGPERMRKQKLRYETLTAQIVQRTNRAQLASTQLPRIIHGLVEMRGSGAAPESLLLQEQLEAALNSQSLLRSSTDLQLTKRSDARCAFSDREQSELYASTLSAAVDEPVAVPTPDFDRTKIAGRSFEDIVASLEVQATARPTQPDPVATPALNGVDGLDGLDGLDDAVTGARHYADSTWMNEQTQLFVALNATLRQQPALLAQVEARIRSASPARDVLISSLGAAGTPASQQLLLELMHDLSLPEAVRNACGFSLIRTPHPSPVAVSGVEACLEEANWQRLAVYGLGTYARLLAADGKHVESDRLWQLLASRLRAARDVETKVDLLLGMSNAGSERILEPIRAGLLADPNADIRRAAALALRLVATVEAEQYLTTALNSDPEKHVRVAALKALKKRAVTELIVHSVSQAALSDRSDRVRHDAVRLLVGITPRPAQVRAALQQVADSEQNGMIKATASAALSNAQSANARGGG